MGKIDIVSDHQEGNWIAQVGFDTDHYYGRLTRFRGAETVWLDWEKISHDMLAYIDRETNMNEKKYAEKYMDLSS